MQQRFGFTKGMRQSISPNKADAQSYYDAMNKRVVVDNKSGTAALTDEPGTRLIATIPSTKPVYTLELDATSDTPNSTVTFYLSSGNIPISIVCARDINLVYSIIMANATLALAILGGSLYVGLKGDKITVVYLDDTSGGLTEVGAGLTLTTVVPSITDAKIIATASIREDLILFTRSGVYGQIWKCRYNSLGTIDILTPNNNLVYNGYMYPDVLANYEIFDIVGRYDNSELVKIYWSNCVDNINHININNKESLLLPIELLSITPDCTLNQPKPINVLSGGLYNAGMVQYGYQLYNLDGAETVISPLSGLIHLTESSSSASSSMSYKGAENGAQVGKAVTVTIEDIDPRFDFIKVIAVYYTSEEGEPEVNVITESNVPQSKTLTIIDAGDTVLSVYTPAQLASIGTKIFTAKLLTTKDNILIAGNVTDQYFDIDEELGSYWDARAYRFKISSSESQVKYDGGTYEAVDATFLIGGEEIPETHDCHLDKSAQSTFKYKPGTNVLGGAGKNVIYDFFVRSINLDTLSDPKHVITTAAGSRQQWGDPTNVDFIERGYTNNNSFTNYASPINQAEIVGYQRDEMYRFGLVVFDGKGRQSFVKWIADIKMPAFNEGDNNVYYLKQSLPRATQENYYDIFFNCIDGTGTYANVLGINFTVNTTAFPSDWKFAIVRSRREDVDKTIVAQGTAVMSIYNTFYSLRQPICRYEMQTLNLEPATNGVFFFYSPETKFNKNFTKTSSDKIRFLNIFDPDVYMIPGKVGNTGEYSKFYKVGNTLSRENLAKGIDDTIQTDVSATQIYNVNVAGTSVPIINYSFGTTAGADFDDKMCYIGSNLAIALENDTTLGIASAGQGIVNYERTLLTQYGGYNYNAKQNSTYQLAGKIINSTGNWVNSRVFGGDTFIEIFDFLQTSLDPVNTVTDLPSNHKSCIYIPVETTINLALRYDTCPSKDTFAATEMKLQETIEIGYRVFPEGAAAGAYPSNLTDLYLYNRVYSKQPTAKTYVGKPLNFRLVEDRDCDVTNSEKHISGELTDSWTRFLFNNKLTVNTSNGPLTKLLVFRNQVMFWQDKAFGLFSFNDRKVITDPNGSQLILGVGSVLDYFQYLSEKSGTDYTRSVVDSGAAIYYYDDTNHKLMMTQGGKEESISDIADCAPLFKRSEFDNPVDVVGVFDKSTRRVLHVCKVSILPEGITTGFNERLQAFESTYSFVPNIITSHDGKLLAIDYLNPDEVYEHNDEDNPNEFYGQPPAEGYVTIVAGSDDKKVFTNVEFNSVAKNDTTEYPLVTVDNMKLHNSYLESTKIPLTSSNLRRRFRTWRLQLPKTVEIPSGKSRYMDYYLGLTLYNTPTNNANLRLEDVTLYYLIPML